MPGLTLSAAHSLPMASATAGMDMQIAGMVLIREIPPRGGVWKVLVCFTILFCPEEPRGGPE